MHSEREVRAQNVVAQKSEFFRLLDCDTKSVDRDGVFCADVEITVLRADCVTCNHHTFDDGKGVSFENGTVHKRARVAFVAVANDVLCAFGLSVCELPLSARWESAAAASSQARRQNLVDDVLSVHIERSFKSFESTCAESLFYLFGIDAAATVQCDANLLFVERDVVLLGDFLFGDGVYVKKSVYDFTVFKVFFDDFSHVADFDHSVKSVFGINFDERSLRAETKTTDLVDGHFVV